MKKFGIALCLLLMFPAQMLAQNSPPLVTNANNCPGLARACSAAARELAAARDLIEGLKDQIKAADDRIDLAKKEIESLKQLATLEDDRAKNLWVVINSERAAKAKLMELKELQEKRITKLEGQLKRSKRLTLIAGVAAGVAILIGAAK